LVTNPKLSALIYLVAGIFFTYVSILSVDENLWNPTTLVLIAVATLSFGASFRHMGQALKKKED